MVMEKVLYTVPETAEMLSVSKSVIYHLIAKSEMYSVKVGGSRRVPAAAITRYIESLMPPESAAVGDDAA